MRSIGNGIVGLLNLLLAVVLAHDLLVGVGNVGIDIGLLIGNLLFSGINLFIFIKANKENNVG